MKRERGLLVLALSLVVGGALWVLHQGEETVGAERTRGAHSSPQLPADPSRRNPQPGPAGAGDSGATRAPGRCHLVGRNLLLLTGEDRDPVAEARVTLQDGTGAVRHFTSDDAGRVTLPRVGLPARYAVRGGNIMTCRGVLRELPATILLEYATEVEVRVTGLGHLVGGRWRTRCRLVSKPDSGNGPSLPPPPGGQEAPQELVWQGDSWGIITVHHPGSGTVVLDYRHHDGEITRTYTVATAPYRPGQEEIHLVVKPPSLPIPLGRVEFRLELAGWEVKRTIFTARGLRDNRLYPPSGPETTTGPTTTATWTDLPAGPYQFKVTLDGRVAFNLGVRYVRRGLNTWSSTLRTPATLTCRILDPHGLLARSSHTLFIRLSDRFCRTVYGRVLTGKAPATIAIPPLQPGEVVVQCRDLYGRISSLPRALTLVEGQRNTLDLALGRVHKVHLAKALPGSFPLSTPPADPLAARWLELVQVDGNYRYRWSYRNTGYNRFTRYLPPGTYELHAGPPNRVIQRFSTAPRPLTLHFP